MDDARKFGPVVGLLVTFALAGATLYSLPSGLFGSANHVGGSAAVRGDIERLPLVVDREERDLETAAPKAFTIARLPATDDGSTIQPANATRGATDESEVALAIGSGPIFRVAQMTPRERAAAMDLADIPDVSSDSAEVRSSVQDSLRRAEEILGKELPTTNGSVPEKQKMISKNNRAGKWDEEWDDELWGKKLEFKTWDFAAVSSPLLNSPRQEALSLDQLLLLALHNAPDVQVFSDQPLIEETRIIEELAAFDWTGFAETLFNDTSEPVGTSLQTGGQGRFRQEDWSTQLGARRRMLNGGDFDVSQSVGGLQSNSTFLSPPNQGNARLAFNYRQPLLRGAGRTATMSRIVQAQIGSSISISEFAQNSQEFVFDVISSYWQLYQSRGVLVQKLRTLEHAEGIHKDLQSRIDIDTSPDQIIRVESAIEDRRGDALVAEKEVRDAQEALIRLVWGANTPIASTIELIPLEQPFFDHLPIDFGKHVQMALQYRPEIETAVKSIQSAAVDTAVARNELLPRVDILLSSFVSGLKGDHDTVRAWLDQFSEGEPSYSVGLSFDYPARNRAAKSRHRRTLLQVRQLESQFRKAMSDVSLDVGNAIRDIDLQRRSLQVREKAVALGKKELDYLATRRRLLTDVDKSISLFLEAELNSQDRLELAALNLLGTQTQVMVAQAALWRASGTLLQAKNVSVHAIPENGLPRLTLDKPAGNPAVVHFTPPEPTVELMGDSSIYGVYMGAETASVDNFIVAPDLTPDGMRYHPQHDVGANPYTEKDRRSEFPAQATEKTP